MAPPLPSRARLVSVAGTLVTMALVFAGSLLVLDVLVTLMFGERLGASVAEFATGLVGVGLAVAGYLVFRFVASRDVSPRTEDGDQLSDPSDEMLWPW